MSNNKTTIRKINGIEHQCELLGRHWHPVDFRSVILPACNKVIPHAQMRFCVDHIEGEEGQYFIDTLTKLADIWQRMPTTYQTRGMGENAMAYIHIFGGRVDIYLTERDQEDEQEQAYGYTSIGQEFEADWVNLPEVQRIAMLNVDFAFIPETVATLRFAGKIH